ncbi:unnamed protein product [Rotaria socialis]|uniref:Helix-turn-helix domain-containing protein n=1 Tax=Rotaria socialis TaxID=392032 RepID=A0A820RHY9_9BILA|nr:unnamed protein product [Rotaria socialis]
MKANDFHPNIKLEATIGSCVPFLDLLINNKNSILSTSVYRQLVAEPCVVPFISDHPPHVFSNIIHAALLRAVRYSSTSEIFQNERRAIRLMLLYNGYPSRYIDTHIRKFFVNSISQTSMIPFLDNESHSFIMRNSLLAQPSVKEREINHRIATAGLNAEANDDHTREKTTKLTIIPKQKKPNKFTNTVSSLHT